MGNQTTVNIQRTSKPLKAQLLLSTSLFWFGVLSWLLLLGDTKDSGEEISWPVLVIILGGAWYVFTRGMIWWRHV